MTHSPSPSDPRRSRPPRSVCAVLAAGLIGAGFLASMAVSGAVAAPQDCLPVVGCVSTTIPPLPTVSVPPLPTTTTLPTLPTTTTPTATAGSPAGTTTAPTATSESSRKPEDQPEAALTARASIRVRGHGAGRTVEIELSLSKPAHVSALLVRSSRTLARRQLAARAGSSLLRIRLGRTTKAGAARLTLSYRTESGETARATYRLRLPR